MPPACVATAPAGINQLAISEGGRRIAYGSTAMEVTLLERGRTLWQRSFDSTDDKIRPTQRLRGIAFNANADKLFLAAADEVLALDADTGRTLWSYQPPRSFGFLIISPLTLDCYGDSVLGAFDNGSVALWDDDGRIQALWSDNDAPRLMFLREDGLAVGTDSFCLSTWRPREHRRESRVVLPERAYTMAASRTGDLAVTRSLHAVTLWDTAHGRGLASIPTDVGFPALAMSSNGGAIALSRSGGVRVVDRNTAPMLDVNLDEEALSLRLDESGQTLLVGTASGRLLHIDLPDREQ